MGENIQIPINTGIREVDDVFRALKTEVERILVWGALAPGRSVTSSKTLDADYGLILANATTAAITLTLPAAADYVGKRYEVKKIDSSSNTVTLDGNASETIDGATTQVITFQYDSPLIESDGTEWWII